MNFTEKADVVSPPAYEQENTRASLISDFGFDIKEFISSSSTVKIWDFAHTKSHINLRIVDKTNGEILYYVDNSSFTPGKPDVTLHAGSDKDGPTTGVCRWSNLYSKQFTMGLGDAKHQASNTSWEQVQTEHIIHPVYQWSIGTSGDRKTFAWHRIRGEDVRTENEDANSWSGKSFKLVDSATDEVLAVFASFRYKSWSNLGRLTFKVDGRGKGWAGSWEVQCLLSILAIIEMSRRRGRTRRSNAGGAGGS